jgi:hypothetical protein
MYILRSSVPVTSPRCSFTDRHQMTRDDTLTDPYLPGVLKYVFEVIGSVTSSLSNESLYLGNITWLLAQNNE